MSLADTNMPFYLDHNASNRNVVISFTSTPRYDFGAFAHGYHLAAKKLAENFLSESGFADYEGYPIVFLYRHALELHFKNVIYWTARLCFFKEIELIDHKLYNTHDLSQLAKIAVDLLQKVFPDDNDLKEFLKTIPTIASEFTDIDRTSDSYRYPINKDGQHSTAHHQSVNIRSIYINLEPVLDKLEALDFGLYYETDLAQQAYEALKDFSSNPT